MRKIMAGLFMSLDGVVEAPDQWHFPYFDDQMGAARRRHLRRGGHDAVRPHDLRRLRRGVAGTRGGRRRGRPFAKAIGDMRKIVVSNQKLRFTWRNSEQLEGDLVDAVAALKDEPGGNIAMSGSVSVVRQLLAAGLLDELHLLVHPITVRKGLRLFDEGDTTMPLRLISSETFDTGVLKPPLRPRRGTGRRLLRQRQGPHPAGLSNWHRG